MSGRSGWVATLAAGLALALGACRGPAGEGSPPAEEATDAEELELQAELEGGVQLGDPRSTTFLREAAYLLRDQAGVALYVHYLVPTGELPPGLGGRLLREPERWRELLQPAAEALGLELRPGLDADQVLVPRGVELDLAHDGYRLASWFEEELGLRITAAPEVRLAAPGPLDRYQEDDPTVSLDVWTSVNGCEVVEGEPGVLELIPRSE